MVDDFGLGSGERVVEIFCKELDLFWSCYKGGIDIWVWFVLYKDFLVYFFRVEIDLKKKIGIEDRDEEEK